ncbi:MAG TPA: WcaI family glycosyltransferase [Verrucomicrobiae bacterium]|nr:WcaI family glycosyltransferase [Verrucomicrobiae bacterium]
MRIHVWGINYSPEVTGISPYNAALCEFLALRGYETRMITSFCYYPAWEKLPTEKGLLFRTDQMDGVTVHRCWQFVPKQITTWRRALHELSFVLSSFLRQLVLPRPDLLLVISPPLLLGPAAWLLSKLKRTKFVFHVQDLQPDAAAELGMVRHTALLNFLRRWERFSYQKANIVSGISPAMLRSFEKKGVPKTKCVYFPNGVELPDFWRLPQKGRFRAAHGFSRDDFLIVYSGNLGRKQGLEILLEAASNVKNPAIKFVICGDGAERSNLERHAAELALKNTQFLPLLAEPRYRELLVDADLSVIPQQPGSGRAFFPSKLLKALAFSCPVLAIADAESELSRAVREGGFGTVLPPRNPAEIATRIEELAGDTERLRDQGKAAFKFVKRFEQSILLDDYAGALERAANFN